MTALIILAAGASSRLGQPKQNLLFQHKTLLNRAIETGLASTCRPVIVVLGANTDVIEAIDQDDVKAIYNNDWNEGMASSIRLAIKEIESDNKIDQAFIMLCDQPFVTAALIDTLLQKQKETGKPIIACTYNNTIGVPVLFNRALFAELLLLKGHDGAKKILQTHQHDVITVPFEHGSIDIDTKEDYTRLLKSGSE
ncbi:nucleotidyltransferase family protein [Mucilaginibacter sp.]